MLSGESGDYIQIENMETVSKSGANGYDEHIKIYFF